jgi:hypothetical protein
MRFPQPVKIATLLVYFFLLSANVYSVYGPESGSPYVDSKKTYITPAPFVFFVWGVIHFLLAGFVIYQFFSQATETVVDGISWHFVFISIWNTIWLALTQKDHPILAWIAILLTASQVSYVYYNIRYKYPAINLMDNAFIHAPFSLYHAWIFVIAVISTFVAFTPEVSDDGPSVLVTIAVVIGLLVLKSTAISYVELGKGDVAGALVIAWALYGIFVEQDSPAIRWTALVLSILTLLYSVKPFVAKHFFGRGGEERAPLLG